MMWHRSRLGWKLVAGILVVGLLWFLGAMYREYRLIRSGGLDSGSEARLQASFSKLVANERVTKEDLARLVSPAFPSEGPEQAKLTIVEFLDYDCPFSSASFAPLREAMAKYRGKIRVVTRDFPIEELHPTALSTAIAARCAHAQNKFWQYHDRLFLAQERHTEADLIRAGQELGLDGEAFHICITNPETKTKILQDLQDGLRVGVRGTPTFFFNGVKIQGALDTPRLEFLIDRFLKL